MPRSDGYFRPGLHKEEAMQALREGTSPEECMKRFGLSRATVMRYLKEAKEGPKPAKAQGTKVGGVTPLGAILIPKDGVATFTVAGEKIELFAEDLFRCYDEYRDMRDLIDWQSDFSSTIREGAKNEKRHTWECIH
jgi:predicted DNA-binding transcriptional regulator AlpA